MRAKTGRPGADSSAVMPGRWQPSLSFTSGESSSYTAPFTASAVPAAALHAAAIYSEHIPTYLFASASQETYLKKYRLGSLIGAHAIQQLMYELLR